MWLIYVCECSMTGAFRPTCSRSATATSPRSRSWCARWCAPIRSRSSSSVTRSVRLLPLSRCLSHCLTLVNLAARRNPMRRLLSSLGRAAQGSRVDQQEHPQLHRRRPAVPRRAQVRTSHGVGRAHGPRRLLVPAGGRGVVAPGRLEPLDVSVVPARLQSQVLCASAQRVRRLQGLHHDAALCQGRLSRALPAVGGALQGTRESAPALPKLTHSLSLPLSRTIRSEERRRERV